MKKILKIIMW